MERENYVKEIRKSQSNLYLNYDIFFQYIPDFLRPIETDRYLREKIANIDKKKR